MLASQGFAPGTPEMFDGIVSADQSAAMYNDTQAAGEMAAGAPVPVPSPNASDAASRMPAVAQQTGPAAGQSVVMADTSVDALNRGITQSQPAQSVANLYGSPTPSAPANIALQESSAPQDPAPLPQTASADVTPVNTDQASADPQPQVQELAVVAPPKKKSIFARMFASPKPSEKKAPAGTSKRIVSKKAAPVTVASAGGDALPGVKLASIFDNDSGSAPRQSDSGQIQLASAAGLARLAPNGLHLQTDRVEVDCFKPQLVRTLKAIERHYGRSVMVTSGYRSPKHNRRVGGASGSRHTSCEAADIQIEGVSKWQLAKYLRSMPGRGGVGTYCHTESVHIDIGNSRDWNWRCRRRK